MRTFIVRVTTILEYANQTEAESAAEEMRVAFRARESSAINGSIKGEMLEAVAVPGIQSAGSEAVN